MNKTFLTRIALGLGLLAGAGQVGAQVAVTYPGNSAIDYVGARFTISSPPSIAGTKAYEITNDGSNGANEWGGAITAPYINVGIVKAYDSLGANTLLNGSNGYPSLAGKFALIFRGGGITFTRKAYLCEQAGAIGVIIVNNVPGGPVGMANTLADGTVTKPVLMISDVDGIAINNALRANTAVTMSLSTWGFNVAHDLGILPNSSVLPHAYAIPYQQLVTGNGNPKAYKNQTGAYIGNFGTSTETNVKLKSNVTWTPTSGSATTVHSDSVAVASFPKIDSIIVPRVSTTYDIHASGTGRFDFNYRISASDSDMSSGDNAISASLYATDSIFSKSRYDFGNKQPFANVGYRFNGTDPYVSGPMYYISKGGYQVKSAQFTISAGATVTNLGQHDPVNINLFKWVDANNDSVLNLNEIELVGIGSQTFTTADTNFQPFTVKMTDPYDLNKIVKVQDNTWYWLTADLPGTSYIGCDGALNYMPRTYVRSRNTSNDRTLELFAPTFDGDGNTLVTNSGPSGTTDLVRPMALESYIPGSFPDSSRFSVQRLGLVPSIAMILSTTTNVGIGNVNMNIGKVFVFPNPSTDILNISFELDKPSTQLYARITDAMGKTIHIVKRTSVQKDLIQISTADLTSGQYYMILNTDLGTTVRTFTVLAK